MTTGRFAEPGSYDRACERATTAQGLDPIVNALRAAHVPVVVDQTGGFCMVVGVYRPDSGERLGITTQAEWDGGPGWLVCRYDDAVEWDDGTTVAEEATTDQVVCIAIHFLGGQ